MLITQPAIKTKVDVAVACYGKPYQTIVAIQSLLQHSGQHIDKIFLTYEQQQPYNDWSGIHRITVYLRQKGINVVVHKPYYFLSPDVSNVILTREDARYRHSIMYQYALEKTDKAFLCVIHNDMLFHGDMIGDMLAAFKNGPASLAGVGSIGQCWSCPAAAANVCDSTRVNTYLPTLPEAIALYQNHPVLRQEIGLRILREGHVHPLPECRLNEYTALINTTIYRKETLPAGNVGCFGGGWRGTDLGTVWFYQMYNLGYTFKHLRLETYANHSPFEGIGNGSIAYSKETNYWQAEAKAKDYITAHYGSLNFGLSVPLKTRYDALRRAGWLVLITSYGYLKKTWYGVQTAMHQNSKPDPAS